MSKLLKAAIIGCGNIGSLYDENDTPSQFPKSHARAYKEHPEVELVAICDKDIGRASACAKFWGIPVFCNEPQTLLNHNPDILSLCTPENQRLNTLESCNFNEKSLKVLICERPFASTFQEAVEIQKIADRISKFTIVNFIRRWDSGLSQLIDKIHSGSFGELITGNCLYGKGFSNNGSHIIDILCWMFGNPQTIKTKEVLMDGRDSYDPTYNVTLTFDNDKKIDLTPVDYRLYSIFEVDLFFTKGRVRISDRGFNLECWFLSDDSLYAGYKILKKIPTEKSTLELSMVKAIDEAVNLAKGKISAPSSTMENAMQVIKIIEAANKSLNSNQFSKVE